jgi:hypothetical protein
MKKILITIFFLISIAGSATTYYLSPTGSDVSYGSIGLPWFTLNKAWTIVSAGDTVYMRGGTYRYEQTGSSLTGKDGTAGNMINIWAYPGEHPIINYDNRTFTTQMIGLFLRYADYIYIKGIRVTTINQPIAGNIAQYGLILWDDVNNCIFEQIETDHIGGWGIVVGDNSSNNLFLNCDSHHNADPYSTNGEPYGWSDGFESASLTSTNNILRGCRFWSNSDDGLDLRRANGVYTIENCWSFWNGYKEDGVTPGGNGEGFKLGGKSAPATTSILRTVRNCLAFENVTVGFSPEPDLPENELGVEMYNCTSYHNALGINFQYHSVAILKNNIVYANTVGAMYYWGTNVTHNHNNLDIPITISDADFVSVSSTGMDGARQADGSLPDMNFLHLALGSNLIDAGIDVGLLYNGSSPDLGAFEFTGINNHYPSIMNQSFQLDENSMDGTVTGTILASDPDTDQTLEYSIVSGNTDGAFAINDSTGVLSVANSAAVIADFALVVRVQDNGVGELNRQATIIINIIPTGIESTGNNSTIRVYPNPVSDELIIEIEGNNDGPGFEILNSIGNIVFKGYLSERTIVPTTNFSTGVYLIKTENGKTFEFKKIVKL